MRNIYTGTVVMLLSAIAIAPVYTDEPSAQPTFDEQGPGTSSHEEASLVYLDFRDTDIREVVRVLSKLSGTSILVGKDVKASITVNLEGVPWRKALDIILKTHNLSCIEEDGFIIIVTYVQVRSAEELTPLVTEVIPLSFANIEDAQNVVKPALSGRGGIQVDKRTKNMIITDTPDAIAKIRKILKNIDTSTPQVLIEVLMVDKKIVDEFDLGIRWELLDTDNASRSATLNPGIGRTFNPTLSLTYGKALFGHAYLDALLQTWKRDDRVDIIANPRILTLDNENAEIKIVEQHPYTESLQSTDGGAIASTAFLDVGVKLNVTPQITQDDHIILNIETEQSFIVSPGDPPTVDSRSSETTMIVKNNETIVLGGLRKRNRTHSVQKVPLLGDVPLINKLFSSTSTDDSTTELIMFVTPVIIRDHNSGLVDTPVDGLATTAIDGTDIAYDKQRIKKQRPAYETMDLMPIRSPHEQ